MSKEIVYMHTKTELQPCLLSRGELLRNVLPSKRGELHALSLAKLKEIAKSVGLIGYSKYTSAQKNILVDKIAAFTFTDDKPSSVQPEPQVSRCDVDSLDLSKMSISSHVPFSKSPQQIIKEHSQKERDAQGASHVLNEQKRRLTSEEIEDIASAICENRSIPGCVAESYIVKTRARVRSQLADIDIYPSVIPDLKKEIVKQYALARIQPGESVGIITAQSIGERQTQMTLDTFHSAGAALKTVIAGVPRFSELLSATHNPKSVAAVVYPSTRVSTVADLRNSLGYKLPRVMLGDLIVGYVVNRECGQWYAAYEMAWGVAHKEYTHHVSLDMSCAKLYGHRLQLNTIASEIESQYPDLRAVWSPTFLGEIDVYFDSKNIEDDSIEKYATSVIIPRLRELKVAGIDGIKEVYYEKKDDSHKDGEWVVETAGSNLPQLLNMDGVDATRTTSNDMWEIVSVLGIEAARAFLIDEFGATISSDGTYVNACHIQLLVDTMTHDGSVMSVSRYGKRKSKSEPLAKASFEESLTNFLKAGVYSEHESTDSVSAAVMLGKLPGCGTGVFDLLVDVPALISSSSSNVEISTYNDSTVYQI